jgi:hypothetical protein
MNDEPKRIHIGTFSEGLPNVLYIPTGALKPATDILDRERAKREAEATKAKLRIMQDARNHGKLKRALTALGFRRGRRGR